MKFKIKQILTFLFILFTLVTYSQLTISNMQYQGNTIPNCGTINLGSANSHNISFDLTMSLVYIDDATDGSNELHWNGFLRLIHMTSSGESIMQQFVIGHSDWTIDITNGISFLDPSFNINLNSVNYPTNGGYLTAEYESDFGFLYSACVYDITKPKFKLNPNTLSVSCGSTGETFTVSNENNSPGNLSYQWSVGSGWSYNGNPVSNFTTSTNSVTLVPTAFPPSNVQVTPVLDGVSYPQLTSTVSLAPIQVGQVTGTYKVCINTSSVLVIGSLPSNATVNWSLSNSNIATIVSSTNTSVTVEGINNGITTVKATISNPCGQQTIREKNIQIGGPVITGVNMVDTSTINHLISFKPDCLVGLELNVFPTETGIINYEWQKISTNFQWTKNIEANVNDKYVIVNTHGNGTVIFKVRVEDVLCGWSNWETIEYDITGCSSSNGGSNSGGINSNNFSIFPVPVSNLLHIDIMGYPSFLLSSGDIFIIKLFKPMIGYVREVISSTSTAEIDVVGLPVGVYILEIQYNNILESHSILIN